MNPIPKLLRAAATAVAALLTLTSALAQPFGQWDFNSGDLSASVGSPLTYRDAATQAGTMFGTTTALGIPPIAGTPASVMMFPSNISSSMGYNMPTPAANGGSLVNDYTLILDVLYPTASSGRIRPIVQTDDGVITAAADLIISSGNGIGTAEGPFFGTIAANTWYRIAFVVNGSAQTVRMYIDGAEVGSVAIPDPFDSRFALSPVATCQILNNNDINAAPGYVNSIQLRNLALSSGQVQALGAASAAGIPQVIPAVPSFILSRTPAIGATGVGPKPNINVVVDQGDTIINAGSFKLYLDAALQPALVTGPAANRYTVDYTVATILEPPLSLHSLSLIYEDSVAGSKTNTWSFRLVDYKVVTLPAPIFFENFDATAEGGLPAGWSVTNATTAQTAGLDLNVLQSDSYKDFVVISSNRLFTAIPNDADRRFQISPTVVNGVLLDQLAHGNFIYSDSDQRGNSPSAQVMALFTPNFNLTGRSNIFVAFNSMYEQNQDNIACLEYSVDGGANWLPVLYMVDDEAMAADLLRNPDGTTNALTTLNTAREDQAYGLGFGAFIAAPVAQTLFPYLSGRINDDPIESKRVELFRLPQADNKASVRLRFMHAGTSSWYWGLDDFGLYSINTPIITLQPQSQTVDAGSNATFTVSATGGPFTYQWKFNGVNIANATSSSFTTNNVVPASAGLYQVVVSNGDGPTTSSPANLTVIAAPLFTLQPQSQLISTGATLLLTATTRGGQPQTYQWRSNGVDIAGATSSSYSQANIGNNHAGAYTLVASNTYGATTSAVAQITVFAGAVTQDLVAHLKFDGDYSDSSGRGNNGTPAGSPTLAPGQVGSGALVFTSLQNGSSFNYVTLGAPSDLNFADNVDFSVSMWVKLPANSWRGDPAFMANKNWGSGNNPGWVLATDTDGHLQWNYREATPNTRKDYDGPAGLFSDNCWHHVVVTFQRGLRGSTYVDGALVNVTALPTGANPPSSIDSGLPTNIGQDGTGTYTDGNGVGVTNAMADDVGLWRRTLTPQEISAIHNAGLFSNHLATAVVNGPVYPPSIQQQPQSVTASVGGTANFAVKAVGGAPLGFQWRFNGTAISGATNRTFALANAQSTDAGNYTVLLSNSAGSLTSAVAVLTVVSAPIITAQPQDRTLNENLDTSLSVTATGGGLGYQWQLANTNLPNAINATLVLESVRPAQAGTYRVIVSNTSGSVTSAPAVLTINSVGPILVTGQWDFGGGLGATCGLPLEYGNVTVQGDTAFGTTTGFGIPDIAGQPANVMRFTPSASAWPGYVLRHNAAPNGGVYVNRYTVIYDVLYPPGANGTWRSLWQTSTGNANDGDFFVNPGNGIGISGNYQGVVTANAWHRIVLAVDLSGPAVAKFIDGVKVGYQTLGDGTDGRWSLDPFALLCGDEDGDVNAAFLSSVQFRNGKMPDAQIIAMGAPTASKIPGCINIVLTGGNVTISWTGGTGPYTLQKKTALTDTEWVDVVTTANTSATVPASGVAGYFRVVDRINFAVSLNGANERPTPVSPAGTGSGTVTLDGNKVTVNVTYAGMTSTVVASHIHGPATTAQAAGVLQALTHTGGTAGTVTGTATLSGLNAQRIIDGLTYVNIHTSNNGGGEIRGQILRVP